MSTDNDKGKSLDTNALMDGVETKVMDDGNVYLKKEDFDKIMDRFIKNTKAGLVLVAQHKAVDGGAAGLLPLWVEDGRIAGGISDTEIKYVVKFLTSFLKEEMMSVNLGQVKHDGVKEVNVDDSKYDSKYVSKIHNDKNVEGQDQVVPTESEREHNQSTAYIMNLIKNSDTFTPDNIAEFIEKSGWCVSVTLTGETALAVYFENGKFRRSLGIKELSVFVDTLKDMINSGDARKITREVLNKSVN